jgi:hypothetical protein
LFLQDLKLSGNSTQGFVGKTGVFFFARQMPAPVQAGNTPSDLFFSIIQSLKQR